MVESGDMTVLTTEPDFDEVIDRRGTGSLKWDRYAGRDVLPMWVADMDFAVCPAITQALRERIGHPVYGYTRAYPGPAEAVVAYLKKMQDAPTTKQAEEFIEKFPEPVKKEKFEEILDKKPQVKRETLIKMKKMEALREAREAKKQ